MNERRLELVIGPARAIRRAALLWSLSLFGLVAVTVSVWPVFRGNSAVSQAIDQLPPDVVRAFGLAGFDTPAGFLRGNLYDFFVPLLMAGAAIGFVNSLVSGEEDGGRLELYLAQPITRDGLYLGRIVAATAGTLVVALAVAIAQFGTDAAVDLRIGADRLAATLALCALLALLHGAIAAAVAGLRAKPALVIGVALFAAVAGCVAEALLPLVDSLRPLAHLSPWDWAFAGDPLDRPTEVWRYLALGVPAILLAALGAWAFRRRDVTSA